MTDADAHQLLAHESELIAELVGSLNGFAVDDEPHLAHLLDGLAEVPVERREQLEATFPEEPFEAAILSSWFPSWPTASAHLDEPVLRLHLLQLSTDRPIACNAATADLSPPFTRLSCSEAFATVSIRRRTCRRWPATPARCRSTIFRRADRSATLPPCRGTLADGAEGEHAHRRRHRSPAASTPLAVDSSFRAERLCRRQPSPAPTPSSGCR